MLEEATGNGVTTTHPKLPRTRPLPSSTSVSTSSTGSIARVTRRGRSHSVVPNMQAIHGCCVLSPDTKYVLGNGEFRAPLPTMGPTRRTRTTTRRCSSPSTPTRWRPVAGRCRRESRRRRHRQDSSWYQAAVRENAGRIEVAGMTKDVSFESVTDEALNGRIDEAYRDGNYEEVNGIPVVDGTQGSRSTGRPPRREYIPTPIAPTASRSGRTATTLHRGEALPDGDDARPTRWPTPPTPMRSSPGDRVLGSARFRPPSMGTGTPTRRCHRLSDCRWDTQPPSRPRKGPRTPSP